MPEPTILPVGDHILIQYLDDKEQVRGGVIIPDSAKETSQEAIVVAVGSGKKSKGGKIVPFSIKIGETVLVARYSGATVRLGEQKFTLVREDDILAVVT